jgi:hypothetical protein
MKLLSRVAVFALLVAGGSLLLPAQSLAADVPRAKPPARAASAAEAGTADCERLWREYRKSQDCFERFRTATGGLRPSAVKRCGEPLPDPSDRCGPQTLPN